MDTASNTVVATVTVGNNPFAVAVTPDGKHVYVTIGADSTVSVIATATNTVVATVPVAGGSGRVAVTPDGKHAYVTNNVMNTVPVGGGPSGVGIVPPPPGVPFLAFAANLVLAFGGAGNQDFLALQTSFILSSTAPPLTEPV